MGKISVWGRFGTFVPSDQECSSVREVTSGRSDWMFANLIEFLCFIQSIHGNYLLSVSLVRKCKTDGPQR